MYTNRSKRAEGWIRLIFSKLPCAQETKTKTKSGRKTGNSRITQFSHDMKNLSATTVHTAAPSLHVQAKVPAADWLHTAIPGFPGLSAGFFVLFICFMVCVHFHFWIGDFGKAALLLQRFFMGLFPGRWKKSPDAIHSMSHMIIPALLLRRK